MHWRRVVEIHSGEKGPHGSGCLLASGLVLTAKHVVEGAAATDIRVIEPDHHGLPGVIGAWQPARIVWVSPNYDLALLAPQKRDARFCEMPATTTIARLAGQAPVRVHALGFPRAMLTPTHSDTLFLEATVNPLSGVRAASLLLDVHTTLPADREGWKGMSGAAVMAADRLVGVIEAVPAKLDAATLRATPAYLLVEDATALALLDEAKVDRSAQLVDAGYVNQIPIAGHWSGVREAYARAVLDKLCSIDYLGLAVAGAPERKTPALAAFTGRRLRGWPETLMR